MNEFSRDPVAPPAVVLYQRAGVPTHRTAVVVGIPQGGTSMLAAVVHALGAPITEHFWNFEPDDRPNCGDDAVAWAAKAARIDTELDVWGLKDTLIWRFPPDAIHNCLRNPYYLVITRDTAAVVGRRCVNHGVEEPSDITGVAKEVEAQVRQMWDWVYGLPKAPLLLVSYERALRCPAEMCQAVLAFLGLIPTVEMFGRAIARISPVGGYLTKEDES